MGIQREMQEGWDFATNIMGADIGAQLGANYAGAVEEAIKQLEENINDHAYRNLAADKLQGYMLEEWAAGTFNVDAVAADSVDRASVLHSTQLDSVDIALKSGKQISAKSYSSGAESAKQQAGLKVGTGRARYEGQDRLVPSDQLSDAQNKAKFEKLRNTNRPNVAKAYAETEEKLTDKVTNEEGISSRSATRKELEGMAKESKDQKFKAEEHGVTSSDAIKTEYLIKQAAKAGCSAAAVTLALQLTPEIIKSIDYLIKNGELDVQQIRDVGMKGISAGAESFLRGSVSASLLVKCETGALGDAFREINPSVLGMIVALSIQTVKNSILVATGKMTSYEMGAAFTDSLIISGGYLLGAQIGGVIGQAMLFELPVAGYILGSLIGTSFCIMYNIGKKKFISFCADTGFTCFGLVDQDYELPQEILDELGIETISIPRTDIKTVDVGRTQISTAAIETAQFETVDFTVLRRSVIGVNKIGYVIK